MRVKLGKKSDNPIFNQIIFNSALTVSVSKGVAMSILFPVFVLHFWYAILSGFHYLAHYREQGAV